MEINYPKPRWWRLYAIMPLTITLFAIDSQLALPDLGHKLVELLIVLVTVALMGLWVLANAVALEWSDIAAEQSEDIHRSAAQELQFARKRPQTRPQGSQRPLGSNE